MMRFCFVLLIWCGLGVQNLYAQPDYTNYGLQFKAAGSDYSLSIHPSHCTTRLFPRGDKLSLAQELDFSWQVSDAYLGMFDHECSMTAIVSKNSDLSFAELTFYGVTGDLFSNDHDISAKVVKCSDSTWCVSCTEVGTNSSDLRCEVSQK